MPARRSGAALAAGAVAAGLMLAACTPATTLAPTPFGRAAEPGQVVDSPSGVTVTVIQVGLSVPWDLAFLPDGRMLVSEREGGLRLYASGQPAAELLETMTIPDVLRLGEGGALGVAVDSEFAEFPYAYVCVTRDFDGEDGRAPAENQLLRLRIPRSGPPVLDEQPLVAGMKAHEHHDGCAVVTDPTGHIWLSMGDANTARTENLAQNPSSLNGKVLRINRDGSIPSDNPILPGASGPTAVYTMGHRNPQGIALREDGLMMSVEHGTDRDDEVNHIVAGGNYGYACWSGAETLGPAQEQEGTAKEGCLALDTYLPPAWASGFPTLATSGAAFLPEEGWGDWGGSLIVSTLKETDLRRFEISEGGGHAEMVATLLDGEWGRLRGLVVAPDGSLFVTTSNFDDDKILRLTRTE
jgi:glucose/arabinose dehydrogenase